MPTETATAETNNGAAANIKSNDTTLAKPDLTISQKFLAKVERQFAAEMGAELVLTQVQKALAQHLYVRIDQALTAAEIKRSKNPKKKEDPPITWANVDMSLLATEAVAAVSMELDAAIPNHLHVMPYLSSHTKKYELDIMPGYVGADHARRKFAIDVPLLIEYFLVYEGDKFTYGHSENGIAYYKLERADVFNPGKVIGGFGYIAYEDPRKNRVHVVEYREFEKARKNSKTNDFWGGPEKKWDKTVNDGRGGYVEVEGTYDPKYEKEMQFKTVVHRVCNSIRLDSTKLNASAMKLLERPAADLDAIDAEYAEVVTANANGEVMDIDATEAEQTPANPNQPEQAEQAAEGEQPGEDLGF